MLKWLPNYLAALGPSGFGTFLKVARLNAAGGSEPRLLATSLPGRPVWLRPALHDAAIFQQVWVKGDYNISRSHQFKRLSAVYEARVAAGERPLIVDCGAHIGLSVLWWHRLFPKARIFAVEPSADNFAVLERNTAGIAELTLFNGAVWAEPGRVSLGNRAAGMAGLQVSPMPDGEVEAITLPGIMARMGADDALVVKLDIEGAEAALFDGDASWLDRVGMLAVEPHDWMLPWSASSAAMLRETGKRGFDCLVRHDNFFFFSPTIAPGVGP
jgi:FkbM family methyltransferase